MSWLLVFARTPAAMILTMYNGRMMRLYRLFPILFVLTWVVTAVYLLVKRRDADIRHLPNIAEFRSPFLAGQPDAPTLLTDLGFVYSPRLYPQSYHDEMPDLPVFIVAASTAQYDDVLQLVGTQRQFFPDKKLVIYNMDLTREELNKLRMDCRCVIRDVKWNHFPSHVKNPLYQAYRPILIQKSLMEFGAVFWCEPTVRFTSAEIYLLQSQAERVGVVAWPLAFPTSALTHYNMFSYFNTTHENYYFHKMVESDGIILYNTEAVHNKLMLPWVKCALTEECVAPVGAKPDGCNLNLHPKYLYTGCHKYDMAAFNVILGDMFKMEMPYLALLDIYKVVVHPK